MASITTEPTGLPGTTASRSGTWRRCVSVLSVANPQTSVTCTFTFEAAQRLAWHPWKCRNLQCHSYRLDVTVSGPLDSNGVVLDFDQLTHIVNHEVIARWDHRDLNEVIDNPTAELLAPQARQLLSDAGLALAALRLWETDTSSVELTTGGGV